MVYEKHVYTPSNDSVTVFKSMQESDKVSKALLAVLKYENKTQLETWHVGDLLLQNVHREDKCQGPCPFHGPSDHHMVEWDVEWDPKWSNSPRLWRICPEHEVGHPDPDVVTWMKKTLTLPGDPGQHHCDCQCCNPNVYYGV
jgi:hypothetical protein